MGNWRWAWFRGGCVCFSRENARKNATFCRFAVWLPVVSKKLPTHTHGRKQHDTGTTYPAVPCSVCTVKRSQEEKHHVSGGIFRPLTFMITTTLVRIEVVLVLLVVRHHRVVVVVRLVLWLPRHLVLLFEPPPGVREPGGHLRQRHLGDDRQHDLFALGRVGVLLVLVQPRLQRSGRFARCILPAGGQIVPGTVSGKEAGKAKIGL